MYELKPITNDQDHSEAMARMKALWQAKKGTPEYNEMCILVLLIEKFEQERYPIDDPDPIEAIKFYMKENGFEQKDFADLLGSRSRASEILNRKRPLNIKQIRVLNKQWHIPAEVLTA
jgi:HTH-type transcriptional regulator / antitoxin HigA